MGLLAWKKKMLKKLTIWDMSLVKLYCLLIGIIIGAYIPAFVQQYVIYFASAVVVLLAVLLYRIFSK